MVSTSILKVGGYLAGVLIVALLSIHFGLNTQQIISMTVFLAIILGAITYWRLRLAFALAGVAIMFFLGVLDIPHLIRYAHFDVILFLMGMMTIIGFLEDRGFFEYLLAKLMKVFSRSGVLLFTGLLVMSTLFAALVDEVTSILFITALTLRITKRYNLDPLPFVIATVMATNVGSSYTVIGNPIGVLIAFEGNLTFLDFIMWATPVGIVVLILTIFLALIYWKSYVKALDLGIKTMPNGGEEEKHPTFKEMKVPWIVFLTTICGLAVHHPLEHALHLPTNSLLLAVPVIMAGVSLFLSGDRARYIFEHRVEWWCLGFFIFFFTSVGTLAFTGITDLIAKGVLSFAGEHEFTIVAMLTWISGGLSAFMDNILAVATLITIVHSLENIGLNVFASWWGILFGACYLGNLTMIGSTANIVALGILEKERKRFINFIDWVKPGLFIAVPELLLATGLLYLQHFVF
ncbi:MAG: ArsB/NhaD family transporter [Candidatus Hecatellaceae archaeon]